MKDDVRKKLAELLGKVDNKVLETKIAQAVDMIKNGEHEEIVKKLSKMDKKEILEKINDFENLPPETVDALKNKIDVKLLKDDLAKIQNQLDPDSKKIIEKMISTFKIK